MATAQQLPTTTQYSAGGVAYRQSEEGFFEVAIILTNPERRWQLPKGMIDDGEEAAQAAQREVREEAGIETEVLGPIERTDYWFVAAYDGIRRRFHKHVDWFLMRYVSGDVGDHDHEVLEARWVPINEALRLLVFKNEREIVEKAGRMIAAE